MPELPEIKRYAHTINQLCQNKTFVRISCHFAKYPEIKVPWRLEMFCCSLFLMFHRVLHGLLMRGYFFSSKREFKISAKARGKELCLYLDSFHPTENDDKTITVCFTHGLVQ
jgi:hypothetical protein